MGLSEAGSEPWKLQDTLLFLTVVVIKYFELNINIDEYDLNL